MNNKILIISFSFEQEQEAFEILKDGGLEPLLLKDKDRLGYTEKDLLAYWNGLAEKPAGILMGADIPLGESFARNAEGLKFISLNCAGSDHLDLDAFAKNGVTVVNVPQQNFDAVADLAWGLILASARKIVRGDRGIRQGNWCEGVERGSAVSKKTIGIIGFGAIGRSVAQRALGFEMKILVSSRTQDPEMAAKYQAEYVDRETLFQTADIVIPTCPLAPETYHLINDKTLGLMKKSAFVINPSRGGIIDTKALIAALREGRIAGAGLDVYEEEPLYESELFELDNVVLTPHIGGLADREIHHVATQSARNMVTLMNGGHTGTELVKGEE